MDRISLFFVRFISEAIKVKYPHKGPKTAILQARLSESSTANPKYHANQMLGGVRIAAKIRPKRTRRLLSGSSRIKSGRTLSSNS